MNDCTDEFISQVSIERARDELMKAHDKGVHILDVLQRIKKGNKKIHNHIIDRIDFIPKIRKC